MSRWVTPVADRYSRYIALDGATNRRSWQQLQTPVGSLHAGVATLPDGRPSVVRARRAICEISAGFSDLVT